jgi:hypothetical protein
MNSIEDQVRAATQAEAATMRQVRPLRLPPTPGTAPRPAARARRLTSWLAPVTAAAVVIALAVSLVIIRDIQNGPVVSPAGPATATGVPPYYVALYNPAQVTPAPSATPSPSAVTTKSPTSAQSTRSATSSSSATAVPCAVALTQECTVTPTDLLVGDTFTGAKVAIVPPPAGSAFYGVTAAADDRTFVVDTDTKPGVSDISLTKTLYLLTIAPGTSSPTRLTRLPIPPLPGIIAIALSGSGRELAVAQLGQKTSLVRLRIYSVATGQLLHSWSTGDSTVFDRGADVMNDENRGLTWVDGDRALDFPASWQVRKQVGTVKVGKRTIPKVLFTEHLTVRTLDVSAGGGDLVADSRAVWSAAHPATEEYPTGCAWGHDPLVSADGKTVVCVSVSGPPARGPADERVHWRLAWLANSISAPSTARTLFTDTIVAPLASEYWLDGLWTNPSGSTALGYWYLGSYTAQVPPVHFGIMSSGGFRPLPTPPALIAGDPLGLAW